MVCEFWLVDFDLLTLMCVIVFQDSLLVIVIMIDSSEKCDCEGGFWTSEVRLFLKWAVSQREFVFSSVSTLPTLIIA